jgi:hypothetical protein
MSDSFDGDDCLLAFYGLARREVADGVQIVRAPDFAESRSCKGGKRSKDPACKVSRKGSLGQSRCAAAW